jgi:hypothetical protein
MKFLQMSIVMVTFGIFTLGCGSAPAQVEAPVDKAAATDEPAHECAACAKGKTGETTWCDSCGVGYVNGEKVTCKACYEGKSGKATWCESCGVGYVDGQKTACKGCVQAAAEGTECEACAGKH